VDKVPGHVEQQRTGDLVDLLTNRELEILALVVRGATNGDIGERLGLTVHAVKWHLASVYRKLGVSNRTEAAAAFLIAGPPGAPHVAKEELA
jgi:DNA-binding CsgD family transcriptional regulator